jgi:hypothetical protein
MQSVQILVCVGKLVVIFGFVLYMYFRHISQSHHLMDGLEFENWEGRTQIVKYKGLRRRGAQFRGHIVPCIVGTRASFRTRQHSFLDILWSTLSRLPRRPPLPAAAPCPRVYFSVTSALPLCMIFDEGIIIRDRLHHPILGLIHCP